MNCLVLQENLHQALSAILRTVTTKSDLPVLSNILLETKEGKLFLSATNLEMGIQTSIGGKTEENGSITAPAKLLGEFVATLPADKIHLYLKDGNLVVKGPNSQAQFATISASEFPPFPTVGQKTYTLSGESIKQIASHVAFAASSDEGRPVLTGLLIKQVDKDLQIAATDGFRLSVQKLSGETTSFPDVIIPARVIQEVAKILNDKKAENVSIQPSVNENQLIFSIADTQIFSRLLEGEFPNYQRIIPASSITTATVDKAVFLQAVKAAAIFARESANIVRFTIKKNLLIISANTPQIGDEKSEIEAETLGEDNEIAFNYRFLIDFLNSTTEERVVFEMTNPLSPGVFHPIKDISYNHIIMPVRVQGT